MTRLLARGRKDVEPPRVWCWDDAWKATSLDHADPPARLSPGAMLAVLSEAIERADGAGSLDVLATALHWPGYRRQLQGRFSGWTVDERPVDGPPPDASPATAEEWTVFGHYRAILRQLGAEDPEGWAVWASRSLAIRPCPELAKPGHVVVIDPLSPSRADWRLLAHCHQRARSMTVILPSDDEPALAELYASVQPIRRQFLEWGFAEQVERIDGFSFRPPGLDAIERELFRVDSLERPRVKLNRDPGLKIVGGPKGEGLGLLVAREVRSQLDRGVPADDILILVPRLDEDAERIRDALLAWDLPVDRYRGGRLATVAAISALRLAMRLPVEDWDVATLVRLLRNGQIRWTDLDEASDGGRFEAASAIRSTRVFRERDAILKALGRDLEDAARARPARIAIRAIHQLSEVIDANVGSGPWQIQVDRLVRLAEALGLPAADLEPLWDALDDQGWVRGGLGAAIAEESWTWARFAGQVDATVAEVAASDRPDRSGAIRIEPVAAAEGARARVVILANLAEKTFPSPDSIELETPDDRPNLAYSREMLRFARVAGSADESLILAYPTTDLNGEPLLPAGFLDDLMRRLDETSAKSCVEALSRLDPVLASHPELARSSADARVLAVALACRDDFEPLRSLASLPEHAETLRATADAFEVAHRRRADQAFGPYDGRLQDPRAIAKIREDFGPEHAFSPSQIESFALCPFQFYQRYVLGLKPIDERRELDEDYAGRGSDVHRVLEQIHKQSDAEGDPHLIERLTVLIETEMRAELEQHDESAADVPQILREIGTRRTNKVLGRYVAQFRSYFQAMDRPPEPHKFEVVFGQEDQDESSHPHLKIGDGDDSVKLQGKIDRIDLVHEDGEVRFRVIDYKTGASPSGKDVLSGLASQLPLYALAVERLVFPEGQHSFHSTGYWSLPKDGFKGVKLDDWGAYRDRLMAFVLALVSELRRGTFPIESKKKECWKYCDYRAACRVTEVRMSHKSWDGRPTLEDEG